MHDGFNDDRGSEIKPEDGFANASAEIGLYKTATRVVHDRRPVLLCFESFMVKNK